MAVKNLAEMKQQIRTVPAVGATPAVNSAGQVTNLFGASNSPTQWHTENVEWSRRHGIYGRHVLIGV